MTPKDLAKEIGVEAKSLRSAMRRLADDQPGSGGRWDIDDDFADVLRAHCERNNGNRRVVKFVPKVTEIAE
jgi:hypothetical protein